MTQYDTADVAARKLHDLADQIIAPKQYPVRWNIKYQSNYQKVKVVSLCRNSLAYQGIVDDSKTR